MACWPATPALGGKEYSGDTYLRHRELERCIKAVEYTWKMERRLMQNQFLTQKLPNLNPHTPELGFGR